MKICFCFGCNNTVKNGCKSGKQSCKCKNQADGRRLSDKEWVSPIGVGIRPVVRNCLQHKNCSICPNYYVHGQSGIYGEPGFAAGAVGFCESVPSTGEAGTAPDASERFECLFESKTEYAVAADFSRIHILTYPENEQCTGRCIYGYKGQIEGAFGYH